MNSGEARRQAAIEQMTLLLAQGKRNDEIRSALRKHGLTWTQVDDICPRPRVPEEKVYIPTPEERCERLKQVAEECVSFLRVATREFRNLEPQYQPMRLDLGKWADKLEKCL